LKKSSAENKSFKADKNVKMSIKSQPPTGAQRSGGTCGSATFSKMFFDRGIMGLWPTQGDEKGVDEY